MSLIDPLKAFSDGIPKMEETSIYASLTIGKRGRSIIEISQKGITTESETDKKVNFLGFDEKTQSYTTNWSEIPGNHIVGQELEGFGMKSINIEVNASYIPKVTIEFVDIRGANFSIGANSKYLSGLFQFPPPEFTLTIKGYFGKSLTYGLHLIKQNTKFNSKTGNFEITAEFIAITFAPLADIPVAYIKAAPFMNNQKKVIDPLSINVNSFYELINSSRVLNKNIEQLKQEGSFKDFEKLGEEMELLQEDINKLKNFDFLNGKNYESSIFKENVEIINVDNFQIFTNKNGFIDKDRFKISGSLESLGISAINESQTQILELIKDSLILDESKNIINKENIKVLNKIGEGKHFNLSGTGSNANLVLIIQDLPRKIKGLQNKLDNIRLQRKKLCDQITNKVESQTKSSLGFRPTIYNIFKIMCDDVDIFIQLLKESSENAQRDTSISKFINNIPDAKVSDETKKNNISRYAWPIVTKEDKSGKKIRIYPGDDVRFKDMPEVKFVDKFIEASIAIAKGEITRRNIDSSDDEGKKDWTPLGPFEEVSFATSSDYGRNKTSVANIMGTLVKRAQVIVNWNLRHEEELSNNTIRVVGSGADKGGKVVDKETTGSKLLESLGILEGQNILHEIIDQKILESIKEIAKKTDINNILKTNDDISNLNGISNKKPLDLYKNSEITINFTHSGENNEYKYLNENNINSAFKIEDSFIPEITQTLKDSVKDIKKAAEEQGFISWLSGLFGNDPDIEVTDENKIFYRDNDTNSKSFWFDKDISLFSFPPLKNFNKISDADKIKNYSDTILRPLFIDGTYIPTIPIGLSKKFNTPNNIAENFLSVLINVGLVITTGTGLDKEFLYEKNANLFLHLETFINKRKLLLPGIIEVPYINLVYWGWYLSILDDNISTDFNATIINKTAVDYLKNLPKIVKDQFIDKFNDFKNRIFPLIKEKIIKDINSTILELNSIQFQQDINNIKDWGKPKQDIIPENAWWFELTKRNYIFLGLPLLLINPKDEALKGNVLDLNPGDRRNKVERLIKSTLKFLNSKIDDKIKEIEKIEKNIESQLKDSNIKLAFYNSFKTINDRWLSGGFSPFNKEDRLDKLISKFSFVDRTMKDIGVLPKDNDFKKFNTKGDGDSVMIDFSSVEDTIENNEMSLLTLIDLILTKNGFQFFPLQNFMLFDSGSWSKDIINIKNVFGINTRIEKGNTSPLFLCVYINNTSSSLDIKKNDGDDIFGNNGFDFESADQPADFTESLGNGKVSAFVVKFSDPNQSMFKHISLDQAEFKETIESIKILDKISQIGSKDVSTKTILKGQNLFNIYEQRSYSCEVEMLGNAMIQPTQYFQLENIPMFHGAYMIIQVNHNISPNQMTTKFKGVRIPKDSLPLVTDYAAAVGFDLCTDSSVEGSEETDKPTKSDKEFIHPEGGVRSQFINPFLEEDIITKKIRITSSTGRRDVKSGSKFHKGIDLGRGEGIDENDFFGTKLIAVKDGIIERVRVEKISIGWGLYVIIKHTNMLDGRIYWSTYTHMSGISKKIEEAIKTIKNDFNVVTDLIPGFLIEPRSIIKKGEIVGFVGGNQLKDPKFAGSSTGTHLHYEIKRTKKTIDELTHKDSTFFATGNESVYPPDMLSGTLSENFGSDQTPKHDV